MDTLKVEQRGTQERKITKQNFLDTKAPGDQKKKAREGSNGNPTSYRNEGDSLWPRLARASAKKLA
ncbi:unnamed protein product [Prunus armeniaca]